MWFCMQAASSSGRDRSPIADHKTLTHCAAEVGQLPEGPPSLRASFALHWYSRDTDSFDIDMSTFTYLITGASRSLGLGYTRQLLKSGNHVRVVAGARNPSSADDLQALRKEVGEDRLYILKLDVENPESVAAAVKELEASGFLKNGPLDCLINNAGVARGHFDSPSQT